MNPSAALPIRAFLKDPRHFQIVFLSVFLVFGILRLHWDADILRYTILLSTALTVQYLFIRWKKLDIRSLKSALITGLGLCLLFHASAPWVLVLGATIAIAGKFLVRFRGKHIFNPANLGIVAAILLTGQAWVSPGQWGSGPVLVFLVGAAGLMVLLRVGRIDTSVAFLLTFAGLDLLRTVLYLGWGLDVWAHRMMNGSLLLFAFFMITDPMTTPNAPRARIAWSMIIALITFVVSTFAYVHTAPIWALVVLCAITPLLDTLFAGERFSWLPGTTAPSTFPTTGTIPSDQRPTPRKTFNKPTRPMRTQAIAALAAFLVAGSASAFCGFYVAKADATLFNDRSEVILVRDGRRTIITMSNDFKGSVQDFAMVVPVPSVLQQSDIRIVDRSVFQMLDNYSSPRLVEYWDENPCQKWEYALDEVETTTRAMSDMQVLYAPTMREKEYGVTIEARYAVGEYDVLILGATESKGLKQWLLDNGYKIPATAHEVLDPYIKSGLKFFVVKVDLQRMQASGFDFLRPIQVSFESDKFMLPIRLGMANSSGVQDMIVYAFTRTGRVECVNYRTVKVPTDRNIPLFAQAKFGQFYKDLFNRAWKREGRNSVALEYAWNVTPSWGGVKCDPCVGPPPMPNEFVQAGVDWGNNGGGQIFFTRLHVRYGRDKFPQDLQFQVTPNSEHFQARYILTHPATGDLSCEAGQEYLQDLYYKRSREMDELYALTGWDLSNDRKYLHEVKQKMSPERRNSLDVPVGPWNDGSGGGKGPGGWMPMVLLVGVLATALYFLPSVTNKLETA